MPRKKGGTVGTRTLIVRVHEQVDLDLRTAAEGLGVDVSNLVRMIFVERLPEYIERGLDARRRAEAARAKAERPGPATKPVTGKTDHTVSPPNSGGQATRNLDI
ncbi:MAG: hypothetical protein U0804_12490 [Gemmataceae bacterium]